MTNPVDIPALLAERKQTHGDYTEHAAITQLLKATIHTAPSWRRLTATQAETLDMIAHKIGRVLAGDPDFRDHWADIAGYAQLVAERCIR